MPATYRPPTRVEPRPAGERAFDPWPDWWRQIDRWVNEGGAEERPRRSAPTSERVEP